MLDCCFRNATREEDICKVKNGLGEVSRDRYSSQNILCWDGLDLVCSRSEGVAERIV